MRKSVHSRPPTFGVTINSKRSARRNMITSEIIETYKNNHGDNCPFCGSDQVDTDDDFREYDIRKGVKVEREMLCMSIDCRKEWTEVFMLATIK